VRVDVWTDPGELEEQSPGGRQTLPCDGQPLPYATSYHTVSSNEWVKKIVPMTSVSVDCIGS